MKRFTSLILLAINILLVVILVGIWFNSDGSLKNVKWQEPISQKINLDNLIPSLGKPMPMDESQFLAMLDRPLFSPTRRPPPPPPPPKPEKQEAPPPPPDYLSESIVSGVYTSADGNLGGVIIKYQNKEKSLSIGANLDGWKLTSIKENKVYFSRDGQSKEIVLQKAKLQAGAPVNQNMQSSNPAVPVLPAGEAPVPRRRGAKLGGY